MRNRENEIMWLTIAKRAGRPTIQRLLAMMIAGLCILTACGGGTTPENDTNLPTPGENPGSGNVTRVYVWDPDDFDHLYEVGPGRDYADPSQVPWESLMPSTLVRIYYRDQAYHTKWVINVAANADAPVVVLGVPDNGRRPVISGENAVTRQNLDYWNENRSVIKIGGSSTPDNAAGPSHIYVQGLDIRSARPVYAFYDDNGQADTYSENAAAIHIESGNAIVIHDCLLHDAGNGLFSSSASSRITISANHVYDNGIDGSIYHHNSYTESRGILFEFNHYGPLRNGCLGNNLKDRSSGTIIRYNWIEAGNRQLDLVETDYAHIADDPQYDQTFVYGNLLIEPDGAGNSQILHYGGDGGDTAMYRQGTLYFYHNTVVSTRSGNTTLMRLSTTPVRAEVFNNILFTSAGGSRMAITSGNGQTVLTDNWMPVGWRQTHEAGLDPGATVKDLGNREGVAPGFVDLDAQDFHLAQDAEAAGGASALPAAVAEYPPDEQYVRHQQSEPRPEHSIADIGAFERI
jgi:hypothetical protein